MKTIKFLFGISAMTLAVSCEKEQTGDVLSTGGTKEQVQSGLGGSMSQFTIIGDYLYTIDYKTLNVFHLADPSNPVLLESINMGVGMETVFHNDDILYIGAQDGVHMYNISNPRSPVEESEFDHVTSCDPVVANGTVAIATLRGGTECGGSLTELDVIDVTDLKNPELIFTTALTNPYGLGFSNQNPNLVYVCDGYAGLKAYDITDVSEPELVMEMENVEAVDVIAHGTNLILLTKGGVYQYNATNPTELSELSFIAIQ